MKMSQWTFEQPIRPFSKDINTVIAPRNGVISEGVLSIDVNQVGLVTVEFTNGRTMLVIGRSYGFAEPAAAKPASPKK